MKTNNISAKGMKHNDLTYNLKAWMLQTAIYSTAFAVPAAVFTHEVAAFPGSAVLLFGAFGATLAQTCVALVNRIRN